MSEEEVHLYSCYEKSNICSIWKTYKNDQEIFVDTQTVTLIRRDYGHVCNEEY